MSACDPLSCPWARSSASFNVLLSPSLANNCPSLLTTLLIGCALSGRSTFASDPKLMIPTLTNVSKMNPCKNSSIHPLAPLKNSFWYLAEPDRSRTKIRSSGFDEQKSKTADTFGDSQLTPSKPDVHWHVGPLLSETQLPPFSQSKSIQGSLMLLVLVTNYNLIHYSLIALIDTIFFKCIN